MILTWGIIRRKYSPTREMSLTREGIENPAREVRRINSSLPTNFGPTMGGAKSLEYGDKKGNCKNRKISLGAKVIVIILYNSNYGLTLLMRFCRIIHPGYLGSSIQRVKIE